MRVLIYSFQLLAVCLLSIGTVASYADQADFADSYSGEVNGYAWVLHLKRNTAFASMITGQLETHRDGRRYMLVGNINSDTIAGSFKSYYGSDAASADQQFKIELQPDGRVKLALTSFDDFPAAGIVLDAKSADATADPELVGIWFTEPEVGRNIDNPYIGEQWVVEFYDDGTMCETSFDVDSRQNLDKPAGKCPINKRVKWKASEGQIYTAKYPGQWEVQFKYRLMGGRLIMSYDDGERRVANISD